MLHTLFHSIDMLAMKYHEIVVREAAGAFHDFYVWYGG